MASRLVAFLRYYGTTLTMVLTPLVLLPIPILIPGPVSVKCILKSSDGYIYIYMYIYICICIYSQIHASSFLHLNWYDHYMTNIVCRRLHISLLIHPPGKTVAILQTKFSNAFWWIKYFVVLFEFHWSVLLRVQLAISQHWFSLWLDADQATRDYLNQYIVAISWLPAR